METPGLESLPWTAWHHRAGGPPPWAEGQEASDRIFFRKGKGLVQLPPPKGGAAASRTIYYDERSEE